MHLHELGWSHYWAEKPSGFTVRIIEKHRNLLRAIGEQGAYTCSLSGKLEYGAQSAAELPAVGDWCLVSPPFEDAQGNQAAIVQEVLPRRNWLSRVAAGSSRETQVLAANVDYAFITTSLNGDINVNRLYRYIFIAQSGQVKPIIVLSKADLEGDHSEVVNNLQKELPNIPVLLTSAMHQKGLQELKELLIPGKTAVFVGSSGVGKSSLVNALLKEDVQKVLEVRSKDDKGRHTTTAGILLFTESGGMIIDTPGLRELQLFGDEDQLSDLFQKIESLVLQCKFSNCHHDQEEDCAIKEATERGELTTEELKRYHKMQKEVRAANRRIDPQMQRQAREAWKKISMNARKHMKFARSVQQKK